MTTADKQDANPEGTLPPRAVPAQPAYSPAAWPANQAPLTPGKPVAPLLLPTVAGLEGWGQALKKAMRLGGPDSNGRPGERSTQKISRHDDGRPITA
jgi:hypothetical protein